MKVVDIRTDLIRIEDRTREDYGDIEELSNSIKEFGLLQPITIDQDYRILAGGRRYFACAALQMESIPCIVRSSEGEVDKLEIELIENIHRKDFTWIERARLERRIYEIKGTFRAAAEAVNMTVGSVHRQVELAEAAELFPEIAEQKTASDAWKMYSKMKERVITEAILKKASAEQDDVLRKVLQEAEEAGQEIDPADILKYAPIKWAESQYLIGDAIEGMKGLENGIFDFAEVDPPYGIDLDKAKRGADDVGSNMEEYHEVERDAYKEFVYEVADNLYSVMKLHSFIVWWLGPSQYPTVLEVLQEFFSVNEVPMIWDKGNQGQTQSPDTNLANCYEMALVARKGRPVIRTPGRSNIFRFNPVVANKKIHPTERPVELIEALLETFASPGQKVIVPFLGSGNTLRACYKRQMTGLGWDLERGFRDKFLLRVQEDVNARGGKAGGDRGDSEVPEVQHGDDPSQ